MDISEEDENIEEQTAQYLLNISRKISISCPAASRYYMFNLKKGVDRSLLNTKEIKQHQFCEHCGSLWSPANHKVRIVPPAKKNNHIKKLLKWEAEQPWKLNNRQKKKLSKYRESNNKIVYSCLCCKKTTKQPCFKRKVQTKEKMTSLYLLPSKVKPVKRDLNAGLLITSQQKSRQLNTQESLNNSNKISNCDNGIHNEVVTTKKPPNLPLVITSTSKNQYLSQNVSNLSKNKKKSLLAQILKQEQEAGKKKSSLSSFLVSI